MVPLLQVTDLEAFYGPSKVLHGVTFALDAGGITAILGANGAGKTTTLRAICRMLRTRGEITFAGETVNQLCTEDVVRRGIAHVPEGRRLFVDLTVEENLRLGAYTRQRGAEIRRDLDLIYTYFPRLKERRRQQAGALSGGEQQMLAIGRALMLRPRLLLLDEPSFGLAPLVVEEIFRIMRHISERENVSILLVEQNVNLALDLASEALVLETGRIAISGAAAAIGNDDSVRRSYLGG